jgi:hypothetical protein
MAQNVNRPNGFQPVGTINGAPWNGNLRVFTGGGVDILRGDLVSMEAEGDVEPVADDQSVAALGVFVGVSSVDLRAVANTEHPGFYDTSAAGSDKSILVVLSNGGVFEAQEDGLVSVLTTAAQGGSITTIGLSAGSTTTGLSGMELDSSQIGTDGLDPLQVLRLVDRPDNVVAVSITDKPNARWLVTGLSTAFAADSVPI